MPVLPAMTTNEILGLLCFLVGFALIIVYAVFVRSYQCYPIDWHDVQDVLIGAVLPVIAIGVFLGSLVWLAFLNDYRTDYYWERIHYQIENENYTVWINGSEVDIMHITIEDYSPNIITIDEEIKEIHIAANK